MKKILIFTPLLTLILFTGFRSRQADELLGTVVSTVHSKPLQGVVVSIKNKKTKTITDSKGHYTLPRPVRDDVIEFSLGGYQTEHIRYSGQERIDVQLEQSGLVAQKIKAPALHEMTSYVVRDMGIVSRTMPMLQSESYATFSENRFVDPRLKSLSTFGIDVDAAAYSNVRRFINLGQLPPPDAVRVEEMINYFDYDYPAPQKGDPFTITTELSTAPWNPQHKLLKIGLQAKKIEMSEIPQSNLVLLIDVSGSMNASNKLPLVKSSLKMLISQLRASDKVSIISYAGAANVILEPTSGKHKREILEALNDLKAGGSTAGEAGIKLAYDLAGNSFIKNGNNRVIMASDGDFNTGQSSDLAMQKLIEEKRKSGIFLSILGFGMGNYKDSKMEMLADKGNGNYAYIDNISEGRKVLVTEFGGTLFTVARDVKLQVEFNPSNVQAYRLIGYENRTLNDQDFKDDLKDAGDLGAGHSVTALYEIIPPGVKSSFTGTVDELKYGRKSTGNGQDELVNIRIRYKEPKEEKSNQLIRTVKNQAIPLETTSNDFRFAASVAGYGMLLRKSEFLAGYTYSMAAEMALKAAIKDEEGFRSEFVRLVKASSLLAEDLLTLTEN